MAKKIISIGFNKVLSGNCCGVRNKDGTLKTLPTGFRKLIHGE